MKIKTQGLKNLWDSIKAVLRVKREDVGGFIEASPDREIE